MLKKSILMLFVLLIASSWLSVSAEDNVYYISNVDEFSLLEEYPKATFYLKNNIVFSDPAYTLFADGENPFGGVLDGKGYTISFLQIKSDSDVVAFIGYNEGTIRSLKIINAQITSSNENAVIGGIVAYNNGIIEDCSFSGKIRVNGKAVKGSEISAIDSGSGTDDSAVSSEVTPSSSSEAPVSTETFSVSSETEESEESFSSSYTFSYSNSTSIISDFLVTETSSYKETSSTRSQSTKSTSLADNKSSSSQTSRPTTNELSVSSDFYETGDSENNVLSVVLLGICAAAILYACGFAIFKEIQSSRKK